VNDPQVSPVSAINQALSQALGEQIGVFIDGARMASPGLLAAALKASRLHQRAVVGTFAFHLGSDVQMRSVLNGYDQAVEDRLLDASGWEEDPYRLFDISVFAGSSANGWLVAPSESNALFLHRQHWKEIGGFDPLFVAPGGGLANLDLWRRLCEDPSNEIVMLLGEATFHQVHGGVATNALKSPWDDFHAEYVAIRGQSFAPPTLKPLLFGYPHPKVLPSLDLSLKRARGKQMARQDTPALPLTNNGRVRDFSTSLPTSVLDVFQNGVLNSNYRGVRFLKSPLDIGLYIQLFSRRCPGSIIEIGCRFGGSALWFADMMSAHGNPTPRVVTVDIDPQVMYQDPRVTVLTGDAADLARVLTADVLALCPRPWLVIEDSSHEYQHTRATLEFFNTLLQTDDYIVIEDGVVVHLSGAQYARYDNGPNRALSDFLAGEGSNYELDTSLCDFYGHNATYNPNGWLRRL
jgi:cephalosporin hydroxylase